MRLAAVVFLLLAAGPRAVAEGIEAANPNPDLAATVQMQMEAGDQAGALALLLQAEPRGAMDPAYNALLADVAMRAADYASATVALERLVLQQPQNAGAWLDLAIASARLGDVAGALQALDHLGSHFDPPPLIRQIMDDLRRRLARPPAPAFRLRASLFAGRDSNANSGFSAGTLTLTPGGAPVELPLDPAYRARADNLFMATLDVAGTRELAQGQWEWRAALAERRYAHESAFDTREGALGAGYLRRYNTGTLHLTGEWRRLEMGGAPLIDVPRLRLGYDSAWGWRGCSPGIAGEAELRRYASIGRYDGDIAWAEANLRCPLAGGELAGALRLGFDNARAGDRPGGDTRHAELALVWQRVLPEGREATLAAFAGSSRDAQGYSPLLDNDARRRINRLSLRGELSWPLAGAWRGVLIGEASRQSSNLPLFELDRSLLLFGVRYQY